MAITRPPVRTSHALTQAHARENRQRCANRLRHLLFINESQMGRVFDTTVCSCITTTSYTYYYYYTMLNTGLALPVTLGLNAPEFSIQTDPALPIIYIRTHLLVAGGALPASQRNETCLVLPCLACICLLCVCWLHAMLLDGCSSIEN